jgi:CubicO group peptidase (beta-lactamase class C family)
VGGWDVGGVAVAVVDLGAVPAARLALAGDGAVATVFEVGSVTKALTGMLLADAIQRAELSLDASVAAILPERRGTEFGSITMRELCTHTSGLPRLSRGASTTLRGARFALLGRDPYRRISADEVLLVAARQALRTRGRYAYSNLGGAVAGQLLAKAAGAGYADLLRERIFEPLGMHSSAVSSRDRAAPAGRSAAGRRRQPWIMDGYAPAGGVISTIADMTRLACGLLKGSAPGSASLTALDHAPGPAAGTATGMFWLTAAPAQGDRPLVWHSGQTGGYASFLGLHPRADRAVIVLRSVARGPEAHHIAQQLSRAAGASRRADGDSGSLAGPVGGDHSSTLR